ncbi:MAG: ABC transporter permease [Rikenellaceae bacterium]|nr:ABC transporter permease [Rikenellaceae bacterium]
MKRLALFFARRYLFSRKSHSVINIISGVSAVAIAVPVAAMVILLSVFNGFSGIVRDMYRGFDPDLVVLPAGGKVFGDSLVRARVGAVPGVAVTSGVLEDNALIEYRGRQFIATVRGVDSAYSRIVPFDGLITDGEAGLWFGDMPQAVVGQGVAYALGVRTALYDPLRVYAPRRGRISSLLPVEGYRRRDIGVGGVFALEAETDGKYVMVPLDFARGLFGYGGQLSGLYVGLAPGANARAVREAVAAAAGPEFRVLTREEQKASLYRIMVYEKWGIFFIILLVLVVASFSVVGSLAMLIIDKRKDIATIITLGGDVRFVQRIFVTEGMLIASLGAAAGLVLGLAFCWAQQAFGFIALQGQTFLLDAYPVEVRAGDVAGVIVSFAVVDYLIARLTVVRMIPRRTLRLNKE